MPRKRTMTPSERVKKDNERTSKYQKKTYTSIMFLFRKVEDADVLEWLSKQPSKKNAVAELIRKEISKQ